jgi:hypothetical protein
MGKLIKWFMGWKLVKTIFRTGEASGESRARRRY